MQLGALHEPTSFNNRLQATDVMLGTAAGGGDRCKLHNEYEITGNNGNVQWQTITAPGMAELRQVYSYDAVNRLEIAAEYNSAVTTPSCPDAGSQWRHKFGYHRWRTSSSSGRTPSDILGQHGGGPHINFEVFDPSNIWKPIENSHVYLKK
jgi:hypothetical protein